MSPRAPSCVPGEEEAKIKQNILIMLKFKVSEITVGLNPWSKINHCYILACWLNLPTSEKNLSCDLTL